MTHQVITWSGGTPGYGDCRPDGTLICSIPGRGVRLDLALLPESPGGPLLFPRLAASGPRFAGHAQHDDTVYEWDGTAWQRRGKACGENAVIYDAADRLVIAKCEATDHGDGTFTGSQGWRYVDEHGQLVPGYKTYANAAKGLFEYTSFHDVTIGQTQSNSGGIAVRLATETQNRVLLPGLNAHAVHVTRAGDTFAIATTCFDQHETHFIWITLAELKALPLAQAPPPPPPPPPDPVPVPVPEPVPVPTVPDSEIARAKTVLAQVRAATGFGANQPSLPYIKAVAATLGGHWGLNGKRGDAHNPSTDILAYNFPGQQPQLFDVLGDAGGENKAQFSALNYPQQSGAVWIAPGPAPTPVPTPTPTPTPTPSPGPDPVLTALVAQVDSLRAVVDALVRRVTALEATPPTTMSPEEYLARYREAAARFKAKGRTSQDLWHSHSVELELEER